MVPYLMFIFYVHRESKLQHTGRSQTCLNPIYSMIKQVSNTDSGVTKVFNLQKKSID